MLQRIRLSSMQRKKRMRFEMIYDKLENRKEVSAEMRARNTGRSKMRM